jgi:hypothetical protein
MLMDILSNRSNGIVGEYFELFKMYNEMQKDLGRKHIDEGELTVEKIFVILMEGIEEATLCVFPFTDKVCGFTLNKRVFVNLSPVLHAINKWGGKEEY